MKVKSDISLFLFPHDLIGLFSLPLIISTHTVNPTVKIFFLDLLQKCQYFIMSKLVSRRFPKFVEEGTVRVVSFIQKLKSIMIYQDVVLRIHGERRRLVAC